MITDHILFTWKRYLYDYKIYIETKRFIDEYILIEIVKFQGFL